MDKPQRTINSAIMHEGKLLSGSRRFRLPLALLLFVAGGKLFYMGMSSNNVLLLSVGIIFMIYSILICFFVQKAEKTIKQAKADLDAALKILEEKEANKNQAEAEEPAEE
ncbi:hypothetical protein BVX97_04210 [bacterium E08(2017)]|nr:hypothetical protein BVX97_04210 [bacterium E08(2017)]